MKELTKEKLLEYLKIDCESCERALQMAKSYNDDNLMSYFEGEIDAYNSVIRMVGKIIDDIK